MFFMVISLGTNIVKEKINGSFIRLKTMPTSFAAILFSKVMVYLLVAIIQVTVIFSVGIFLFPFINLPKLVLPDNMLLFLFVVILCSYTAVCFALMIGIISKTVEQANGVGAVSVIIFAALGGIWVPVFVMPDYLQVISRFSPLYWCLDGFYVLFLKGGNWNELYKVIISLTVFIVIFQAVTFHKLKIDKIL
jgi:ABC-2 type transport system permease protein